MPATGAMAAASAIEMDGLKMNAMSSSTLVGEHGAQIGRCLAQAAGTDEARSIGRGPWPGGLGKNPTSNAPTNGGHTGPCSATFAIRTTRPRSDYGRGLGHHADWPALVDALRHRAVTTKMDNAMSEEDSPAVRKSNPTA